MKVQHATLYRSMLHSGPANQYIEKCAAGRSLANASDSFSPGLNECYLFIKIKNTMSNRAVPHSTGQFAGQKAKQCLQHHEFHECTNSVQHKSWSAVGLERQIEAAGNNIAAGICRCMGNVQPGAKFFAGAQDSFAGTHFVAEGGFGLVHLSCYMGGGLAQTGLYPGQLVALKTLRVRWLVSPTVCVYGRAAIKIPRSASALQ